MSDQRMKILQMLEEGKITVEEAGQLLSKVDELQEEAEEHTSGPQPPPHPHGPSFPHIDIPHMPDVGRIVSDAMNKAFREVGRVDFTGEETEAVGPMRYQGARFSGALLEHTNLTDAKMDRRTRFEGADLRHTSFVDADLRGADLRGADLSHSDFTDAKLNGADLRGARMSQGSYIDTDFRNADLRAADLSHSDLTDADFKGVKEPGLSLRGVTMVGLKYYSTPEDEAEEAAAWAEAAEGAAEEAASWVEAAETTQAEAEQTPKPEAEPANEGNDREETPAT